MGGRLRLESALLLPLLADLLGIVLYMLLLPHLVSAFRQPSVMNTLLVGAVYLLFCGAVYLLRRQPPRTATSHQWLLAALATNFGFFVLYMMADGAGFFDNLDRLDGTPGTGMVLGITLGAGLLLVLVFLYPVLLSIDIRPAAEATVGRHFLSLLGINLMILVTAAYWQVAFAGAEAYEGLALGGKLLIFLVVYLFFLLFFAAPRTLSLLKNPSWVALASFLLQTGYYVWNSLSRGAW